MNPIVYTTDAGDDPIAFAHAAALARASGNELVALHAADDDAQPVDMPDAADLLARWGAAPIAYRTIVHACCEDPVETVLDAMRALDPALVVASTRRQGAVARFFVGSRAEAIAHNVSAPALLVPEGGRGFVSAKSGAIALGRVVVPVGTASEAAAAVRAALWLIELARVEQSVLVLVHVGEGSASLDVAIPERPGIAVERVGIPTGDVVAGILGMASRAATIVMPTHGHDSVADVLLGSHTDRVLHGSPCPVLSVPL